MTNLDTFTTAYLEAMLWSTTDESDDSGGEPLDANYTTADLSPEAMARCVADCQAFLAECSDDLRRAESRKCDESKAGHDFWLTRNGHGAGFWDGDWPEPYAAALTAASQRFGEVWVYVGDDGQIHLG